MFTLEILGSLLWITLLFLGLSPRHWGVGYSIASLMIGILFLLEPLSGSGVVDLRSYFRHQYIQPGLTMVVVSGAIIAIRCWLAAYQAIGKDARIRRPAFSLITLFILASTAAAFRAARPEGVDEIRARVRSTGAIESGDEQRLMLAAAREYPGYGPAEGNFIDYRFAPTLCRSPGGPTVRISASGDSSTHGQKLYVMFAKQRKDYMQLYDQRYDEALGTSGNNYDASVVNQVLVKESWTPRETNKGEHIGQGVHPARCGGHTYLPGARRELFIMVNVGKGIAGTDEGWIYGTVSPDGNTVTSAGLVRTCMKCHDDAPHEHLFGLPIDDDELNRLHPAATQPASNR